MEELSELILFENENVRLDFKRDEYTKEKYSSFLKDVISMANASTPEIRYIIIGLKPKSIEDRGIVGLKNEITDAATFQQLVIQNIEPELIIDYFVYSLENNKFGIFKISSCDNPPYLMKKDYGNGENKLLKGEGFIRKGAHQTRLIRADYDKYFQNKININYFKDEIQFLFTSANHKNEILLKSIEEIERPSQIQKTKIQKIIENRKRDNDLYKNIGRGFNPNLFANSLVYMEAAINRTGIPYENRDTTTLEEDLKNVEQTYFKDDCYEIFEKQSNKCNISIFNNGNTYIEDASIIIKIPKTDGITISKEIYKDPNLPPYVGNISLDHVQYPDIKEEENYYIIKDKIGNIKHQMPQEAFRVPIRIFATNRLKEESFVVKCELFAKNIKTSVTKEIVVKAIK
jgi:hypothetical protein